MLNRSNIRLGITGALLLLIFGAFSACAERSMTGVDNEPDNSKHCVVIDHILYCAPRPG